MLASAAALEPALTAPDVSCLLYFPFGIHIHHACVHTAACPDEEVCGTVRSFPYLHVLQAL